MSYAFLRGVDPSSTTWRASQVQIPAPRIWLSRIFDCHDRGIVDSEPHQFLSTVPPRSRNAQLWCGEEEISLRRKTLDVLLYLVDHAGQLVTKAALLDAIWSEVTVSDSMPAICVGELRKALGDEAKSRGSSRPCMAAATARREDNKRCSWVATRQPPVLVRAPKPIVVGREDELARLRNWYSHVLEGQRRVIFVAGEAGIGKTTFVQTFLDSVQARARRSSDVASASSSTAGASRTCRYWKRLVASAGNPAANG